MRPAIPAAKICLAATIGLGLVLGSSTIATAAPGTTTNVTPASDSASEATTTTITSPTTYRYGQPYTVTGTGEPNGSVLVRVVEDREQASVSIGADGTWSHTFPFIGAASREATITAGTATLRLTALPDEHPLTVSRDGVWDRDSDTLTITGTGTPDDAYSVKVGGNLEFLRVDGDGTWTHTLRTSLQSTVAVTVKHRGFVETVTFTDPGNPVPPAAIRLTSATEYDRGQAFTIAGTAASRARVDVYVGTGYRHSAYADGEGRWSFQYLGTTEDAFTLTFKADRHEDVTRTFTAKAESGSPSALAVTSGAQYTKGDRITVSGKNTPGKAIDLLDAEGTFLRTVPTNSAGDWSFTTGGAYTQDSVTWKFVSGGHTVTKTFTGVAAERPAALAVTSDTTYTKGERITVSGKNTPGAAIALHDTKGVFLRTITTNAAGDWTFTTGGGYTQDSVTWKFVSGQHAMTETFTGE